MKTEFKSKKEQDEYYLKIRGWWKCSICRSCMYYAHKENRLGCSNSDCQNVEEI